MKLNYNNITIILNCKIIRSDGSEKSLKDIYVLHITHRKAGPLSIDYLTQTDGVSYDEHNIHDIKTLVIEFEDTIEII